MKRSWVNILTAGVVIAVLTLFLGLQYDWLSQAGEASRERMQKRAEEDTKRVAADFNREIQAAYFNFQADPARLAAGDASELRERYSHWARNAVFREFIRGVFYVGSAPAETIGRFDLATGELSTVRPTEPEAAILRYLQTEKHPASFLESSDALLVPLFNDDKRVEHIMVRSGAGPGRGATVESMPKPGGYVVVQLDGDILRQRLLPEFAARHIAPGEFTVSAVDREGRTVFGPAAANGEPDARAALFDLTPDNLIFFSNREVLPRKEGATAVFNQTIESRTLSTGQPTAPPDATRTFTIQMRDGEGVRRSAVVAGRAEDASPWTLKLQHNAGSIDRFVTGERNRSLAIGFAVYLALVAGILAIVVSAQRARNVAQRQVDFVSSISHEFRTPLAVIYSAAENLADGVAQDGEQVSRYGDVIKKEGRKLSAMVEQILEFAGARSGKRKYRFAPADVAEIVRGAVADARPILDEAGFEVELRIADELPVRAADADALSAAVTNLIQNSVKYSDQERWLRVAASNGDGQVRIEIEDRGIGISKTDRKRIFEPFFRSKAVVDSQIHGNGLGLSLVREVVEAHHGTVSVATETAKGSKFTVTIPQR